MLGFSGLDILAVLLCTAGVGVTMALEIRSYSEKWGFRVFLVMTAIPFLTAVSTLFVWAAVSIVRPGLLALFQVGA
ncbi:heme/copper-type cytochrome/quinol oxidase subunit 4 [Salinibacter ruber]|uniref:hypothetical protein n=1 Tax=Salinibacter ruber TaxID=146919 RepID=UPI00216A0782|nr:hypothetical protein [Salinibacter ruber]MCS3830702.1 heme/copper-type cytochrome/quinol oxidase subunit 4 [Salinibacter ruber]MCS4057177.1 heme/copper-type cytochrome/quinol oxidase subunit 4 [Salinibacter ruber]MCS4162551.1 heme/copper-type cytochrome/quinol oxidase subunit 4 [Salinibacter ruber]